MSCQESFFQGMMPSLSYTLILENHFGGKKKRGNISIKVARIIYYLRFVFKFSSSHICIEIRTTCRKIYEASSVGLWRFRIFASYINAFRSILLVSIY